MRHYSAVPASVIRHQPWIDGLVLLSTGLFGLLLAFFVLDVLPAGGSPGALLSSLGRIPNPLARLAPPPAQLAPQPVGVPQAARGVVAQVVEPRWTASAGGLAAPAGTAFLVLGVVIDNQGTQPIAYGLEDWQVLDSGGRATEAQPLRGAGWLSAGRVDPGQRVQGTIAFTVPQGGAPLPQGDAPLPQGGAPLPQGDAPQQVRFSAPALRAVMRWDGLPPAGG
jgi:hypothetical protein